MAQDIKTLLETRAMYDLNDVLQDCWKRFRKGGNERTLDRKYRRAAEEVVRKYPNLKSVTNQNAFEQAVKMAKEGKINNDKPPEDFEVRVV